MGKNKICLRDYVKEGCIFELKERDKNSVLKTISFKLKELGYVEDEKSANEIFKKLAEREKLGSTGIIKHIAIPHCKTDEINKDMVILVGYSKEGVEFKSHDGKPVHIIFAVFTRKNKVTLHLGALAAISRLVSKHSISSRIEDFLNKEKLREITEECEYAI
ncbi:PTS system, nitrogen regulatory IIA component [Thermotomaculum hydrothermale]|uniref:PTS system, nitrogen regulatory IIA component n=1 Tax=Thermotomaculum hydrothermale TaxID=981385 RepID=A0A7R6PQ58_9BACT|nr:PTS sugar transporter subunit IIA [Thermotomaculum hydrothermale]BBB32306.1 PTS system, nitrogen regulatory IIA component [Thermotomaculum hydrothermale]